MTRLAASAVVAMVALYIFVAASASAWFLVAAFTWAYNLLGPWLLLLIVLGIAEVWRREKRRCHR